MLRCYLNQIFVAKTNSPGFLEIPVIPGPSNEVVVTMSMIQNYLLPSGSLGPGGGAMILMGPRALGMGPVIDVLINWKFPQDTGS